MLQYIDPNVDDENFYSEGNTSLVRMDLNYCYSESCVTITNKYSDVTGRGQFKGK